MTNPIAPIRVAESVQKAIEVLRAKGLSNLQISKALYSIGSRQSSSRAAQAFHNAAIRLSKAGKVAGAGLRGK